MSHFSQQNTVNTDGAWTAKTLVEGADEAGMGAGARVEHSKHTEEYTPFPSEIRGSDRFHGKYRENNNLRVAR